MNKNGASCNSIQAFHKKFISSFFSSRKKILCHSSATFIVRQIEVRTRRGAAVSRESIWPFHPATERGDWAFKGGNHNASDTGSPSLPLPLSLSCSLSHLPDRTAVGAERTLYEASAFLSWPYLVIDGFMATANVPFLNNLCCYHHGQLPYNCLLLFLHSHTRSIL